MAESIFDRLPCGIMDDFHEFREDRYPFTYFCKSCGRGFDSDTRLDKCKFCAGEINLIRFVERKGGVVKKNTYSYYCPICERNFITTEKFTLCRKCKNGFVHAYEWKKTRKRDRLAINIQTLFNAIAAKIRMPARSIKNTGMPGFVKRKSPFKSEELPTY